MTHSRAQARWSADWARARTILCIRLDSMGDVLMTTPALHALRQCPSDPHLTLLTSASGAALAPFLPCLDDLLVYTAPWHGHLQANTDDLTVIDDLRRRRFDAAVIFTVYSQSPLPAALLCRLAGIPKVLAYCRENPYGLVSHWVAEPEPQHGVRHEVERQRDLVGHIGARCNDPTLRFRPRSGDRIRLYQRLRARGLHTDEPWIVAHCGAAAPSRRYPASYYAQTLNALSGRAGTVILTGTDDEQPLIQSIAQRCRKASQVLDLSGQLSLGELACLIEDARLLLTNNTGPAHLAAALGTPVVSLYALTNPQHTPWAVPSRILFHDVPCKYCYRSICPQGHHDCLQRIPPERVCAAVLELLADTTLTPRPPSTTLDPESPHADPGYQRSLP